MEDKPFEFSGFHKKTYRERVEILNALYPELNGALQQGGLDFKTANLMTENCIGKLGLPLGLGLHFVVNGRNYIVPMATEEPSIVAAACSSAKLVKEHGGFRASSNPPIMIGQIHILEFQPNSFQQKVQENKSYLIQKANENYCSSMTRRGGGVVDVRPRILSEAHALVEVIVNVCDSMGANVINNICENLSQDILELLPSVRIGMRILTNYCTERKVCSEFTIPLKALQTKGIPGSEVAKRILESYQLACIDVYRACTHNKGIMNGIVAVGVACGQDTRALEAAAHAWASRSGTYSSLTEYFIRDQYFCGKLEMPISVATQGGALRSNSLYQEVQYILGYPTSTELASLMVSVGLANNFAALRALVTEGIQRGHMSLHAKNIALAASVPNELVEEVVEYMKQRGSINQQTALDYLSAMKLHIDARKSTKYTKSLNTFFADLKEINPPLKLSIAFDCPRIHSIHISIHKEPLKNVGVAKMIQEKLFVNHKYDWIIHFLQMLDKVKFEPKIQRTNRELRTKLKLVTIWINILSFNLLNACKTTHASEALHAILENDDKKLHEISGVCKPYMEFGLYLIRELWHVLNFHTDSFVSKAVPFSDYLAQLIKFEMEQVIKANINSFDPSLNFEEFFNNRKKQMCATMMYLCDSLGSPQLDQKLISALNSVGDVLECLSSALRDFSKVRKGEHSDPNAYKKWISLHGGKDTLETQKRYFAKVDNLVKQKIQHLKEDHASLVKAAEQLLQSYYTFSPKL